MTPQPGSADAILCLSDDLATTKPALCRLKPTRSMQRRSSNIASGEVDPQKKRPTNVDVHYRLIFEVPVVAACRDTG